MKVLALEASTQACSVALFNEEVITDCFELKPRQHTQLLLPMINELLTNARLTLNDLDALAVSIGPGSFAGLRIGAGIIQALSFAYRLPVALVSSLQIAAQTIYDESGFDRIAIYENAHMGEIYFGEYKRDKEGLMQSVDNDQLLAIESLPKLSGELYAAGSALSVYEESIKASAKSIKQINNDAYPKAKSMIKLALQLIDANKAVPAQDVLPTYLRTTNAWRK